MSRPRKPVGMRAADWIKTLFTDREAGECWPWDGTRNDAGYGRMSRDENGEQYVHRIMYSDKISAPIPEGITVEHDCHTRDPACDDGPSCPHRACCNPEHLDGVSQGENRRRARRDVRGQACESGKHFPIRRRGSDGRCVACYNEYQAAYHRERRAAATA